MKLQLAIPILAMVAILGTALISDTQGRNTPSTGEVKQRTRPGTVKSNPKHNLEPSPMFLLNKISALEKKTKELQQQVEFLKTHRHPYKKTRVDARCGWMNVGNFLHQIENYPNFKRDCGLFLGSTKPTKNKPKPTYTDKPVK